MSPVFGLAVLERSLSDMCLVKCHTIILCPRCLSVPVLGDFLGLGTWYVVMLTAKIIMEKKNRAKGKARQASKRPCSSDVTQDTDFPYLLTSWEALCGLHAHIPIMDLSSRHFLLSCSKFQAPRREAGVQNKPHWSSSWDPRG